MRFNDFKPLHESSINIGDFDSRNSHYWINLLQLIKTSTPIKIGKTGSSSVEIANPEEIFNKLNDIWDGTVLATSEQIAVLKKVVLTAVSGETVKLTNIFKAPEIKGQDGINVKSKFWNLGNLVEGIMGAAVTAKFQSASKEITSADIIKVLKNMKAGNPNATKVKRKAAPITPYSYTTIVVGIDTVTFTLSLNTNDMNGLQMSFDNPKELKKYPNHEEIFKAYDNAANYVNAAETVNSAIDRVFNDPRKNHVIIESEGGSSENQTSTKADLFITIDNVRERLLSIKSKTVPQIGQVSGHAFANLEGFFKSTVGFGLPASFAQSFPAGAFKEVGKGIFDNAFPVAYEHIFNAVNKSLAGDDSYPEYNFIKQVYDSIIHHATLGEEVIIVYLSPSAKKSYTELKFGPELLVALSDFDLKPIMTKSTTMKIVGIPVTELGKKITDGKSTELMQMRSYVSANSTIRNIVEIGPLLKLLTDVEKINARKNEKKDDLSTTPPPAAELPVVQTPKQTRLPRLVRRSPTPSGMTAAPTSTLAQPQDQDYSQDDELARVRKNAGIQVE
jgi:hypothetical protein